MAPSGVVLSLSGNHNGNNNTPAIDERALTLRNGHFVPTKGALTGTVTLSSGEFVLLLNGYNGDNRTITASFDLNSPTYFGNVLNHDPFQIESKGHYLYTQYSIPPSYASITGSGVLAYQANSSNTLEDVAFITTGSLARNNGSSLVPNFEQFTDRFSHPQSTPIISQKFGSKQWDLFTVHALDDGDYSNSLIKLSIENINKSTSDTDLYGTFDLVVRKFGDNDNVPVVLEAFRGVSLNPSDDRFIARVIGDQNTYFDFDNNPDSQKIIVEGSHPVNSGYIRIKQSNDLENGEVPKTALPMGFRGAPHLITSGSGILSTVSGTYSSTEWATGMSGSIDRAVQPPVQFRENVALSTGLNKKAAASLYWGVQFSRKTTLSEPNRPSLPDNTIANFTRYFPDYSVSNTNFLSKGNYGKPNLSNGAVLNSDSFNKNKFTLENIKVRTGSD